MIPSNRLFLLFLNHRLVFFLSFQSYFKQVFDFYFSVYLIIICFTFNSFINNLKLILSDMYKTKWLVFILSILEISLRRFHVWSAQIIRMLSWKSQSELVKLLTLFFSVLSWLALCESCFCEEPFCIFLAPFPILVRLLWEFFIFI